MSDARDNKWVSPTALAKALEIPRGTLNSQIARNMYGSLESDPSRRGGPRKFYFDDILLARLGQVLLSFLKNMDDVATCLLLIRSIHLFRREVPPERAYYLLYYDGRTKASDAIISAEPGRMEKVHLEPGDRFTGHWVDRDKVTLADIEKDALTIRVWEHAEWTKKLLEKEGVA